VSIAETHSTFTISPEGLPEGCVNLSELRALISLRNFMFNLPLVTSSFALRGDGDFILFEDFISLYQNVVFFSYQGESGFGFCKEITLSDDPALVIYSVLYEKTFRSRKLRDFDFIELRKF
jgi:hypothetical protein